MHQRPRATRRTRIYGLAALLGAVALAGWLAYLLWSGRWSELDPVFATSAVVLLWISTLLDARAAIAELRDVIDVLSRRESQVARQHYEDALTGHRRLIDRYGPP